MINDDELVREIVRCKQTGEISPALAEMLRQIATHCVEVKHATCTDVLKEEIVSESMTILVRSWNRFDETKSNKPVSFFYLSCVGAGLQVLSRESKEISAREHWVLLQD